MPSLFKMVTSVTIVLAGFLIASTAMALPGVGAIKQMPMSFPAQNLPLTNEQGAKSDEATLKELVKQVGLRLRIRYGRYYPRYYGIRRNYYYPSYRYGYKRQYYSPYKYRKYRKARRYKRRYKRQRALRRLRHLLRHRYYY